MVSLALVAGVGIWGYKLLVRDVSGVPVVRALNEPMRIQPEDPGGKTADHQGLAVNAVAANGTAAPPAEELALAPRAVDLTEEDAPMPHLAALRARNAAATEETEDPVARALESGSVEALVAELTAGVKPLEPLSAPVTGDTGIAQPQPLAVAPAPEPEDEPREIRVVTGPGVQVSPRPQARPRVLDTSARSATVVAAAFTPADSIDIDPDSLPPGTRLAQIGAFDSPEAARSEWDRMSVNFSDYLIGKKRVIQRATSGGRVFYRLRAFGFEDLSDARRFCSALVAEGTDCIPVSAR